MCENIHRGKPPLIPPLSNNPNMSTPRRQPFLPSEKQYILENMDTLSREEMAAHLDVPLAKVSQYIRDTRQSVLSNNRVDTIRIQAASAAFSDFKNICTYQQHQHQSQPPPTKRQKTEQIITPDTPPRTPTPKKCIPKKGTPKKNTPKKPSTKKPATKKPIPKQSSPTQPTTSQCMVYLLSCVFLSFFPFFSNFLF